MGKIKVHEFATLDGIVEAPSWTADYGFTDAMGQAIGSMTAGSSAILLGRTTYDMFAPVWSTRSAEDDPGVPFFNDSPKYVVTSSALAEPVWNNSTALDGYDPKAIQALKEGTDGDLYVSGSATLVRALLADGLVDELHLLVYPLALGSGLRLFPEGSSRVPLALVHSEAFDNGVLHVVYGPAAG